jgi:hypothetical protein
MFQTGDVIEFYSNEAEKKKYHLCISLNSQFIFINSPKCVSYPGDFITPASDFPFLPPGHANSVISCSLVMEKTEKDLKKLNAKKLGSAPVDTLKRLLKFIENDQTIPEETKEKILDGLADWL